VLFRSNYSAAKLGLLGLSNTLSIEGKKYNIQCNTIAPVAASRLTETVMPEDILKILKPEYVAPLVLFLCHEDTKENGSLFEVGGGWVGKVRWQKSSGSLVKPVDRDMTPEDVRDKWSEITSFDKPLYHATIGEATNHCIESCSIEPAAVMEVTVDKSQGTKFSYDFKSAILYALSLGVSTANEKNLKFLYENHPEFSILPSFGVIPAFGTLFSDIASLKLPYDIQIDPAKLLHGEQYLEIYKPFSPNAVLELKTKLVDVLDKGTGATLVINVELFDEKQEKVAVNQFVTFLVGAGGFGGKRNSDLQVPVNTKKI